MIGKTQPGFVNLADARARIISYKLMESYLFRKDADVGSRSDMWLHPCIVWNSSKL